MRCNWCLREIHPEEGRALIDKLVLHTDKVRLKDNSESRSCAESYRDYCQAIKEGR